MYQRAKNGFSLLWKKSKRKPLHMLLWQLLFPCVQCLLQHTLLLPRVSGHRLLLLPLMYLVPLTVQATSPVKTRCDTWSDMYK